MTDPQAVGLLRSWVEEGSCLGGQLYLWQDGHVLADVAAGERAPGQPAAAADAGPLLCATKPLVAVCLAQQVQRSRLTFDDPIRRFIPGFQGGGRETITIRQLLSHQSRFPNLVSRGAPTDMAGYVAMACGPRLEPRNWYSRPTYNMSIAWCLLAEVLQTILGVPIASIVSGQIADVLTLPSLTLRTDGPGRSHPYYLHAQRAGSGGYRPWSPEEAAETPNPAYGGYGSARDLGIFYTNLLRAALGEDSLLLRPDVVAEMIQPQGSVWSGTPPAKEPIGLGFFLRGAGAARKDDRLRGFSHFGSVGFRYPVVWSWADPARRMVASVRLWSFDLDNARRFQQLTRALARQPRSRS